jgi:hypothetical protein
VVLVHLAEIQLLPYKTHTTIHKMRITMAHQARLLVPQLIWL